MWSEENGPYEGRHYRLAETLCMPEPIGERPPIMIGGGGEKKTLWLVARYGDACNLFATDVDEVAHKLDVLRAHCAAAGRDYDSIEKTLMFNRPVLDETDAFLADVEEYAELGITAVQVLPDRHPVSFAEQLAARIVPRLDTIG
jgi:alkanesulfonate monooxygenase SsuD/methylene tetrahydromethanopterin reductase-like flavin-dependent oxidoreductase (luciferase family)